MPQEWEAEFDKYRGSPEYVYKNADISMDDFKFIWSMEYGHRMWGRTIGAVFYIPAAVMWAKGFFNKEDIYENDKITRQLLNKIVSYANH